MVPPESATGDLNQTKPHLTLQIDENHSDMVKFSAGDHRIRIIADKLEDIGQARGSVFRQARTMLNSQLSSSDEFLTGESSTPEEGEPRNELSRDQPWNHRSILLSLRAPERDRRLEQIDDRVGNTFDWAFDDDSTGLCTWLSRGSGLFWVCGKPGSGKSTFMKHLYQDTRTAELLRASSIGTKLMVVSFFFHHRGNHVQKSFEGLLRSLVSQILEQEELLFPNLYPIFEPQFPVRFESQHKNSLRNDIRKIFGEESFRTSRANSRLREIVDDQLKLTAQHRLGVQLKELLQICMGTYGEYDFEFEIQDDLREISDLSPRFPLPKIQEVLRLHYHRVEQTKKEIISSVWTRDNLHDALRRLFSQDQFKMNILLILDALDEYGGQPEFIASILQDLDDVQAPSTRLRIIFSSRPWKVFTQEFANTPGFRIHEHTGNDIEELCATQIPQNDSALHLLSPLIPEIVTRARGVFIWVKLVMTELSLMAIAGNTQMPHLQEELSRCLDSVPDELDHFYRLIVQRIPNSVRWDSYVILETISRFGELLSVDELVQIVRLSSAQNFSDAQKCFTSQQGKSTLALGSPQFLAQSKQYLETTTGGLVEVVMSTSGIENPKANVQFMHQSVQDFVQSSDLKSISLGASRARLVVENGYSFLSKYLFTHPHASSKSRAANFAAFGLFARKAEHTTGYSQIKFFQPQPGETFLPSLLEDHLGGQPLCVGFQEIFIDSIQIRSVIELAVVHGLKLCLDDALKEDPQCISRQPAKHRPDLVGLLLMCTLQPSAPHGVSGRLLAVDTAEFLLAKGLSVSNNITGLGLMIKLLWVPPDDDRMTDPAELKEERSLEIHLLAETLVQGWTRVASRQRQPVLLSAAPMLCSGIGEVKSCPACRSLHLIESLLRLSMNTDNSSAVLRAIDCRLVEDTPLDRALAWFQTEIERQQAKRGRELQKYPFTEHHLRRLLGHVHAHICLLVELGGRLRCTKRSSWTKWTQLCVEKGLSTRLFEDKACPSWIDEKDAAAFTVMALSSGSDMFSVDCGPAGYTSPMRSGQQMPKNQGSVKRERGRVRRHMEKVGHRMKELFGQDPLNLKQ